MHKPRSRHRPTRAITPRHLLCAALHVLALPALAQTPEDVLALPLEQLLDLEVTSVSRKPQKLSDAAAAVFVITRDDIRRSGATHIAEALRMAPGVNVARINASDWAVSIRGFNGMSTNKLQVMVDGRSVYSPIFSGVRWNGLDMMLDDVERIEVIRGPGGAVWGANAVNGVINVITRAASQTQGTFAQVGGGRGEQAFGELRHGASPSPDTHYRVYGRATRSDNTYEAGTADTDPWKAYRTGFRLDKTLGGGSDFTLQGEAFNSGMDYTRQTPITQPPWITFPSVRDVNRGTSLRARWSRNQDAMSDSFQAYLDHQRVNTGVFDTDYTTLDLEGQRRFAPRAGHDVLAGLGIRFVQDDTRPSSAISFVPAKRNTQLTTAFISDDIELQPDRLRLTLGTRVEHNDFTGVEVQPNARLWWQPTDGHTLWGALSRAVRTPSRAESDGRYVFAVIPPGSPANPAPLPMVMVANGSTDYKAERLLAWELGYRNSLSNTVGFDLTSFRNYYGGLRTGAAGTPAVTGAVLTMPVLAFNGPGAVATGVETTLDWRVTPAWRLAGAYSHFHVRVDSDATFFSESTGAGASGASPAHQASLRSSHDLSPNTSLDIWVRHSGQLPALNIDRYTVLDARFAWRPRRDMELALTARNLGKRHVEYVTELGTNGLGAVIDRALFASLRLWY